MRRSFDFGLRPSLRMTNFRCGCSFETMACIFARSSNFPLPPGGPFLDPGRLCFVSLLLPRECGKLEPRNKQEVLP